jgi:hypothetical protein
VALGQRLAEGRHSDLGISRANHRDWYETKECWLLGICKVVQVI